MFNMFSESTRHPAERLTIPLLMPVNPVAKLGAMVKNGKKIVLTNY